MVVASYGLVWRNFWAFVGLSAIISLLSVVASIVPFGGLIGTPIGLAAIIVAPIGLAAIVVAGLLALSRGAMPVFGSIGAAFKRFLPVVVTSLLYGLAVIALLLTVVGIPFAIYLAVRWSFVTQAVMVERMGMAVRSRAARCSSGTSGGDCSGASYSWRSPPRCCSPPSLG